MTTMTEICYLSPLSIHSYRWVQAFSNKGYRITWITDLHSWVAPNMRSTPIYTLPNLNKTNIPWRFILNTTKITSILKRISPDFVHLHVQHHYMPAIALSGIPFVLSTWGAEVLALPYVSVFHRGLAKMAALTACVVTVDAECLKEAWMRLGIPESKIEVFPFGVDPNIFNPNVDGQSVRQDLEIDEKDMVVISTRPFYNHGHYDVECLIRAIPSVVKSCENVKFIVKGSGPLEAYLKNLAEKLGVAQHVRFIGLVPYSEMAQFLSAADIYVSTSFFDSTSVSLLEAMACGLAPIVTDIPGNREWVEDGINGFLFPPRNHAILAEKVIQLAENSRLRTAFGRRCVDTVKKRATWEYCVSRMEAVYEEVIKR